MDQTQAAFSLAHKVINTLASPRFRNSLRGLWANTSNCDVRFHIQQKQSNELTTKLARFHRHRGSFEDMHGYLDNLAEAKGIKLLQRQKKGQLKSLTIEQYIQLRDFIYQVSAPYRPYVEFQSHQFELHELLWSFMDYQAVKDAIENGTTETIDRIFNDLVATKPLEFFTKGHFKDLLIIDRLSLLENPKVVCIRTMRDYLSTLVLTAEEAQHRDDNALYFNVA